MKISESLEQLARYNLQKRGVAGQVDVAAEKLKRFNTILDMFAESDNARETEAGLSARAMMDLPVQSSLYGCLMQALSTQLATERQSPVGTELHPPVAAGRTIAATSWNHTVVPNEKLVENLSEKERIHRSVARCAAKYNLPENLIKGVIRAESAFNPRAVSAAGAQGLMQLMPGTARELGVTDAFDIDQNIDGGARYLKQMLDRFEGDVTLALAAYNAGPATVDRFQGQVPFRETVAYVDRVLKYSRQFA